MIFLSLLIIPVLIALGFFILANEHIGVKYFVGHVVLQILVAIISCCIIYYSNTSDTEVWNGKVLAKSRDVVSCRHSYSCNCRTQCSGSGKNQSCYTVCDTCYEHSYDVDWDYETSDGGSNSVDTIDRQGLREPPRWKDIVIGEASSSYHRYTNYIKAAPGTLFKNQGLAENYNNLIPEYPEQVYDYYRANKVFFINGLPFPSYKAWNKEINDINSRIGHDKQCNVVLVFAIDLPQDFYYALEEKWLGGKKNDIIVVMGLDKSYSLKWATIMAWPKDDIVKVKLRSDIMDSGLEPGKFFDVLESDIVKYYERKPMKDFEYLKASITPTGTELTVSIIIGMIISIIAGFIMIKLDLDNPRRRRF